MNRVVRHADEKQTERVKAEDKNLFEPDLGFICACVDSLPQGKLKEMTNQVIFLNIYM